MSYADEVFKAMCMDILENGISSKGELVRAQWPDGEPAHTIKKFGVVNRYDLSKEFPIITLRPMNYAAAIDEILWIWQKKSNKIKDLSSRIWDSWADSEGTIGRAYGYQLSIKHKYKEGNFDQVDRVLFDLKNNPYSRRIIVNMYNHSDLHAMALYPCAYSVTFNVTRGRLNVLLNQRSQDVLVANGWNVLQYAVLTHMFASVSGFEVGDLLHVIADAHIYDKHTDLVQGLVVRQAYGAPVFKMNRKNNFYSYTVDDFEFVDYKYGAQIKGIPVAI